MITLWHWYWFGLRCWWWRLRNSEEDRAFLMVRQGVYFGLELAHRIRVARLGEIFAYGRSGIAYVWAEIPKPIEAKDKDGKPYVLGVAYEKIHVPFETYEDERVLFVVDGEVVTGPVQGTGLQMDMDTLSNFNRGDAMAQLSDSFRFGGGLGWGSMKWFLLVGAIAVIAFVVYKYVLHGHLPGAAAPIPSPTPTPSPGPIYALYSWALWAVSNA